MAVHGLADMGLLVRDRNEYVIVPKAAARIVWEEFFKPLGDIATYVACDSSISHGIIGAGVICRMDNGQARGDEHFDNALDSMIKRYAEAGMTRLSNSSGGEGSPRELILHAIGDDMLRRKQIVERVSTIRDNANRGASSAQLDGDRLSWYLRQLRREGEIAYSNGKYMRNRQC